MFKLGRRSRGHFVPLLIILIRMHLIGGISGHIQKQQFLGFIISVAVCGFSHNV